MLTQVTDFLCGPFFYPVFLAGLLHAFDFFVLSAAPESAQSQPRSALRHPTATRSLLQPARYQSEKKTEKEKK